jgi:Zn-dependent peptidase ImmA (M78 family)/transcriptional regulator with XRE-family HTH domain
MCDIRTVDELTTRAKIGSRIAEGREDAGLTQLELAECVGLGRTVVAKIEAGTRKISATELVAISLALDRPIDWFVSESPPAVLSRRNDPSVGGQSRELDRRLDRVARDVAFLCRAGILPERHRPDFSLPKTFDDAENLAKAARAQVPPTEGAIYDLQAWCEQFGLLAFSFDLGSQGGDAAYVEVDEIGVAVLNGAADAGRRRFNLAHELGHHLVGDAYAPDAGGGSGSDTERLLNAFAVHLLMPRASVQHVWDEWPERDQRMRAVAISARFRTSWSATCGQLRNLNLITSVEREQLTQQPPLHGDFLELEERWVPELDPPSLPPKYSRSVVSAYRTGQLTGSRTVELLWNTIAESDLPEVIPIPLEGLRREFEPIE